MMWRAVDGTSDRAWFASAEDAEEMRAVAADLARHLRAGDLVILDGPLGAGKTTFTQGLAAGLGVRGPISSPTFVISRIHPSEVGGPALVHVDAYRVGADELEDMDLETWLDGAVAVVEWGIGRAEGLADDHLVVRIERTRGAAGAAGPDSDGGEPSDVRRIVAEGVGERWTDLFGPGAHEQD